LALLERQPNNARVLRLVGICEIELHRPKEALVATAAALALEPHAPVTLVVHAHALTDLRLYKTALEAVNQALILDPLLPSAHSRAAVILSRMRRHRAALAAARRAVDLAPHDADILVNLSLCALRAHRALVARRACLAAVNVDPHNTAALNNLAISYQRRMRLLAAYRCYRAAVVSDAQDALPQQNMWGLFTSTGIAPTVLSIGLIVFLFAIPIVALGVIAAFVIPYAVFPNAPLIAYFGLYPLWIGLLVIIGRTGRNLVRRRFRFDPVLRGVIQTQRPRLRRR
jgi:tetratricopeptide (TPR) repeat protein